MDLVKEAFDLNKWILSLIESLRKSLFSRAKESPAGAEEAAAPEQPKPNQLGAMTPEEYLKHAPEEIRPWLYGHRQPTFAPWELQQFSRIGMNPEEMAFMPRVANLMRSLKAQDSMFTRALQGKEIGFEPGEMDMPESLPAEAMQQSPKNMPMPNLSGSMPGSATAYV